MSLLMPASQLWCRAGSCGVVRSVEHSLACPSMCCLPLSRKLDAGCGRRIRYSTYMTAATGSMSPPGPPDVDELRANLRQADPASWWRCWRSSPAIPAVIDRFGPKISHVPDPPERAGVTDPDTAAALVNAVDQRAGPRHAAPTRCPPTTATFSPGCCRWRWVQPVDDEQVRPAAGARRLPAVAADAAAHRPDPRHDEHGHHRCGYRGHQRRAGRRRRGRVAMSSSTATRRSAGPG